MEEDLGEDGEGKVKEEDKGEDGEGKVNGIFSVSSSPAPSPSHSIPDPEMIQAMEDRLQEQECPIKQQHGAGASSSNPPLTIDRDVSTALHQLLPSLDPDTADDTLVTPVDTTTHPANTPADATTLDCAED
ncbi:hypothetical protein JCGZ_22201 [Jatropha curcas]|uniref:Uncharacterized protein n=1 Tax=Jatropha curcas TaxID=180498 RepID=A0A067JSV1_JATCU|nr:hypothetical protein JCGZ_22201 [Jatropha curcas]